MELAVLGLVAKTSTEIKKFRVQHSQLANILLPSAGNTRDFGSFS